MEILLAAVFALFLGIALHNPVSHADYPEVHTDYQQDQTDKPEDHFKYIDGPFATPQDVTETCLI